MVLWAALSFASTLFRAILSSPLQTAFYSLRRRLTHLQHHAPVRLKIFEPWEARRIVPRRRRQRGVVRQSAHCPSSSALVQLLERSESHASHPLCAVTPAEREADGAVNRQEVLKPPKLALVIIDPLLAVALNSLVQLVPERGVERLGLVK